MSSYKGIGSEGSWWVGGDGAILSQRNRFLNNSCSNNYPTMTETNKCDTYSVYANLCTFLISRLPIKGTQIFGGHP